MVECSASSAVSGCSGSGCSPVDGDVMIKAYRSFFPQSQSGMIVVERSASPRPSRRLRCECLEELAGAAGT
jgi:hypothetical protein